MRPDTQAKLQTGPYELQPLQPGDFEKLYAVAADPAIWEQHPNKDRYKREVFAVFFEGALQSGGAYLVVESATGKVLGSSRFYDYQEADKSILIGYTFYATTCWGKGINRAIKKLMLDYIFQFVERVYFHVGAANIRSQLAITRVGAKKIGEINVAYHGEPPKMNFVYEITKADWLMQGSDG